MDPDYQIPFMFNPGVLTAKLPDYLLQKIKIAVTDLSAKQNALNQGLVASIEQEYETPDIPDLIKFIDDMYDAWKDTYRVRHEHYKIGRIWTNYMKKGEFNPNHCHPEALAAFVIWVTIPFNLDDEVEYQKDKKYSSEHPPKNSAFEFTYSMVDGKMTTTTVFVDKAMEGTVSMFPGTLMHCVYPFYTSDGERVSIAGNIIPKMV